MGLLLLDTKIEGWNRVRGRIEQMAVVHDFKIDMQDLLNKVVRPIIYPACIQNIENAEPQPSAAQA